MGRSWFSTNAYTALPSPFLHARQQNTGYISDSKRDSSRSRASLQYGENKSTVEDRIGGSQATMSDGNYLDDKEEKLVA